MVDLGINANSLLKKRLDCRKTIHTKFVNYKKNDSY